MYTYAYICLGVCVYTHMNALSYIFYHNKLFHSKFKGTYIVCVLTYIHTYEGGNSISTTPTPTPNARVTSVNVRSI